MSRDVQTAGFKHPIPEIVIIFVAATVRFWRLDYHSFWFDEAVSLKWAGAHPFRVGLDYMVPVTFRLVEEKHPPVYYTILYFWREALALCGLEQSEIALRSLGAILGIATVVGMLLLVERISGRVTALLVALLVALSPVLVWYSQELRMFQPAVTFIVWAIYCMTRAWDAESRWRRWRWWLLALLFFELALYAYLFSAFVLPAAAATLLLWLLTERTTRNAAVRFAEGTIMLLLTGIVFTPLARNAWLVNGRESMPGVPFANFWETSRRHFKIFTIWREEWPSPLDDLALLLLAILTAVGILAPYFPARLFLRLRAEQGVKRTAAPFGDRRSTLSIAIWLLLPYLLGNLLLATNSAIFKEDRYHIYLVPFLLWATALGIRVVARFSRWLGWIGGTVAVASLLVALPRLWSPDLLREDWRAAAEYIDAYQKNSPALPSAVVAHVNYTHLAMDWYLQQRYAFDELPVFGLFGDPLTAEMIPGVIAPPLLGIVDYGSKTLWLSQSHLYGVDDAGVVEGWLRQTFPVITEQYPTGIKLTGFALQTEFAELPRQMVAPALPNVEIVPGMKLVGCEVTTPLVNARDERIHPPSGWVHVRLWWTITANLTADYVATARLVDPAGIWGERLYREDETTALRPTSTWRHGQTIRDELDINLNPATPPGEYTVVIGVRLADGPSTGNEASCGTVQVWH